MSSSILRIGTRGSELALAQTHQAIAALKAANPGLECEIRIISTAGDQRTDIPLHQVNAATNTGDKGVFIAAIEEALAAGEVDCAVHSLKDMPGVLDSRFDLTAVLPREAIQDVLVMKTDADESRLVIATGSVRRSHLVHTHWNGSARTVPVRGNVATRLRKMVENPEVSATLLARAGLNRLGYPGDAFEVNGTPVRVVGLPVQEFPPALGQGAIALECRRDDATAQAMVRKVNHEATFRCISCERAFLNLLQADCSVPVGGYAEENTDGSLTLHVVHYSDATHCTRLSETGMIPGQVAAALHRRLILQPS
ncbi:MAG: hydroxymethylbilane synthase [Akkermansia sp.]|nr:hydroxymethylbilane synthase [Akkermansia sp.]